MIAESSVRENIRCLSCFFVSTKCFPSRTILNISGFKIADIMCNRYDDNLEKYTFYIKSNENFDAASNFIH